MVDIERQKRMAVLIAMFEDLSRHTREMMEEPNMSTRMRMCIHTLAKTYDEICVIIDQEEIGV